MGPGSWWDEPKVGKPECPWCWYNYPLAITFIVILLVTMVFLFVFEPW